MSRKDYKENHTRAWCYFIAMGQLPVDAKKNEWVLHHVDMTLRALDPVRYNEWRVEDLVPMLRTEHAKLHGSSRTVSEETKSKISQANIGKRRTPEQRQRISEATKLAFQKPENIAKLKARPYHTPWNKGMKKPHVSKPPQKGRIWVTDGQHALKVPPDAIPEGWTRGRGPFSFSHSEETKQKMRHPKSEETKQKMRDAWKKRIQRT